MRILGKFPDPCVVAVSGGQDSLAALRFIYKGNQTKRTIVVLHVNHGTDHGNYIADHIEDLVKWACPGIEHRSYVFQRVTPAKDKPEHTSWEAHWRRLRQTAYKEAMEHYGVPVITGHHLGDVAEWWLYTALRGDPHLTPYRGLYTIKPFLAATPQQLHLKYQIRDISEPLAYWEEDPSNGDVSFARNRIRHKIVPQALKVHPGFMTTMRKKVIAAYEEYSAKYPSILQ